ncbi:MAG: RecX family transcriptional regulator [Candidatus Daviesbacteria bacterium]|nr:RecX family transcriptional regulator [Candidatus Daviesbacteria bacterium]
MPEITSVEPQKQSASRRTKRFNIFLDGEFAFGADEDLVVNRRLVIGKIIDQDELNKILFEAEVGKLMEKMYRLWNIRQRSEREVRNYFRIKGKEEISQLVIDALVEALKKKGMVNDLEFAKVWTEARRKSKQKGIRAIKAELFQKGIDKEIIEEVVRLQVTGFSEEELAKQALEKKMKFWKNLPTLGFRKKAFEFLMRKGFEYEVVRDAIEKIMKKE